MPLFRTNESHQNLSRERSGRLSHSTNSLAATTPVSVKRSGKAESPTPVLLLIVVLASLATMLWYRAFLDKYSRGLNASVVAHLNKLYPNAIVQIGRVAADGPGKIIVNNIRIATTAAGAKRPVVAIHRAVLHGDLDVANWIQNTTCTTQVDLHGVRVDVWPVSAELWSVQTLQLKSNPNTRPPAINIHDATVRLFSDATPAANVIAVHDISGSVVPVAGAGIQQSPLSISLNCRSTGLLKELKLNGIIDVAQRTWTTSGSMESFHFSPKLLDSLPPQLSQTMSQLSGLECLASCSFVVSGGKPLQQGEESKDSVSGDAETLVGEQSSVNFEVQGRITGGRLRDPRLPYPLEELNADFFCKNQMLQLRTMRASSGDAELELNCDIMGFGRDVPMVIHAKAKNLEMDSRLRESLPINLQEQWDRLQLSGRVSGEIQLTFDGVVWTPTASLFCEDVDIRPWLFPYPLTEVSGTLRYQHGTISSERLVGSAGGQPISGSFSLSKAGSEWYGWLDAQSSGAIAVDEPLLAALSQQGKPTTGVERFVRSLKPGGTVQLARAHFERASVDDPIWHRMIEINVLGGSIKYDLFPYPIHEIQGRIAGQDSNWWLHRFTGRKGSGTIICSGNWSSSPDGEVPFDLRFEATAVQIEQELQRALTQDVQSVWEELQPSGSIDRVAVQLSKRPSEPMTTRVAIEERSDSNQSTGRSLQIQPKNFQVWLSDIDCNIEYEPGRVLIHNASAVNGDTRLSIRGECQPQLDGRWLADIQWQPRTRLIVDGQLLRALPKTMRDSLVKIDFRGPLGILGRSQVLTSNEPGRPFQSAWDCQLDIENGQLGDGKVISGLRGTILARGTSDGTNLRASGTVAMDALTVQGVPITRLRGPYLIEENMLYFGSEIRTENSLDSEMTADALTGKLTLAGVGRLVDGKLILRAGLQSAELSGLLRDVGVERASTQAKCDAKLNISGIPWNTDTWAGDGDINLTDAKLFQLPFMIRLLGTASVNASDDSAFQTADIHFDIDGDKIPLQIKCEGEVLRLRGDGWVNLRRDVDLELYSYVGRRPIYSVVSPLLTESRFATFMMIEVEGTLDNPIMQRRPFPQIEATLQQIFPEVAQRNSVEGLVPDRLVPWR